jgi:tetratricopeptide (TPR) repeat protein
MSTTADTPLRVVRPHAFVVTFTVIIAIFVAFLALDFALARIERTETAAHAADLFAEGNQLLAAGRTGDAIDRFGSAHTMERDSVRYALALARAALAHGEPADAEETLVPLLETNATDGAVNLVMARVLLAEHRTDEAISYYHRAIYGRWFRDSLENRTTARFELIDLLATAHKRAELLAELLPLDDGAGTPAFRTRLARLFLVAGSPGRARDLFRAVLRASPHDADAFAGVGEASLALGNFRTARADLRAAQEARPNDARIDSLATLADSAAALDPGDTRIPPAARYQRTLELLQRAIAVAEQCPGPNPAELAAATNALAVLGKSRVPAVMLEAQGDANVGVAAQLVKHRAAACPPSFAGMVLSVVLAAVPQR